MVIVSNDYDPKTRFKEKLNSGFLILRDIILRDIIIIIFQSTFCENSI